MCMYLCGRYMCHCTCIIHVGKSTKVHLYYCMKNCAQSPAKLRESILNIVDHYQVRQNRSILYMCNPFTQTILSKNKHTKCFEGSACRRPGYKPSKVRLTSPAAIEVYETALKATLIYKNAESYCRVGIKLCVQV